jgi:uncharacterized protein YpuA (DUF1002 family)
VLTIIYEVVTASPWAVAGTVALVGIAFAILTALGVILYEDLRPKGHHRS